MIYCEEFPWLAAQGGGVVMMLAIWHYLLVNAEIIS
jgi:hypothetical protein